MTHSLISVFMLLKTSPSYERPPVLRDHFGLAEEVVSQDRCLSSKLPNGATFLCQD